MALWVASTIGCKKDSNPVSSSFQKENLIVNGDFADSLKNWLLIGQGTNPYHPNDPGRASFSVTNGVLKIDIANQGQDEYSIMLYQSVALQKDSAYTVSFDAKSDSAMQIISNVTQDVTWNNITGDRSFSLTTAMSNYSYQFTQGNDTTAMLFQFCFGNMGARKIYLDNISITTN